MDLGLEDKVVVITGGSKGIGAACVEVFAKERCDSGDRGDVLPRRDRS